MRDVLTAEKDVSRVRSQHACHQIDEAGLAGTVRSDQRVPRPTFESEIDVACHRQRAEALAQLLGFEPGRAHGDLLLRRRTRSIRPSTPPRAKTTKTTMNSPI